MGGAPGLKFASLLPLLGLILPASGAAASEASQGASVPERFTIRGLLVYDHFTYVEDRDAGLIDNRNEVKFLPTLEFRFSESVRATGAVEARADASDPSRSRIAFDQLALDFFLTDWDIRIGRQTVSWGQANLLRPLDFFKRHDFTDFMEDDEEPVNAATFDFHRGDWTLEWVWVPVFEPDIFPLEIENRWSRLPSTFEDPEEGEVILEFETSKASMPPKNPSSSELGFRAVKRGAGLDWGMSAYYGYDRIPTFLEREVLSFDESSRVAVVELTPVHERIAAIGIESTKVKGSTVWKLDSAYVFTSDPSGSDPLVDDPYWLFAGGFQRTFFGAVNGDDIDIEIQYALDLELPRRGAKNQDETEVRLRHFFEHAVVGRVEYRFDSFHKIAATGYVNVVEGDRFLQAELVWQPMDALTFFIGGDVMGGSEGTFLGLYRDNNRVRARVELRF